MTDRSVVSVIKDTYFPIVSLLITMHIITSMYFNRQVVVILTQLEGSDGFSVSHRLNFRTMVDNGDGDYGAQHMPELGKDLFGLHSPRPIT